MKPVDRSLPLAFVLAAAVQMPGTILPDASQALQAGALAPLMGGPAVAGSAVGWHDDARLAPRQRTAQRFLNFGK